MNKDETFKQWKELKDQFQNPRHASCSVTYAAFSRFIEILDALIAPESSPCHAPIINEKLSESCLKDENKHSTLEKDHFAAESFRPRSYLSQYRDDRYLENLLRSKHIDKLEAEQKVKDDGWKPWPPPYRNMEDCTITAVDHKTCPTELWIVYIYKGKLVHELNFPYDKIKFWRQDAEAN